MNSRKPPGARPTRLAVIAVAAFLIGMAASGLLGSQHDQPSVIDAPNRAAGAASPGPQRDIDGVPSGFARTRDGARAAAVQFVLTGETLLAMAPTRVQDAIRTMAAAGSADTQVSDAEDQLAGLRERLAGGAGPIRYVQAVLASRVDAFTPERAQVSVWSVGVLSRTGVAQPQAGWTTSTFELVWERGDWRIWDSTVSPGPTPTLNESALPSSSEQLDQALVGFVPWDGGR